MRRSLELPTLALAVMLLGAACGGGASGNASPTPSARPSSPAKVAILAPTDGQVIRGSAVHVRLSLTGARIVKPTTTHIVTDRGHVHLLLDGRVVTMTYGLVQTLHDVKPGNHLLQAEFVASDHLPWNPRVIDAVTFEVKR